MREKAFLSTGLENMGKRPCRRVLSVQFRIVFRWFPSGMADCDGRLGKKKPPVETAGSA